ncbi:MerR family transcriptional regulator [Streptomyces sp. DSM 42041]|uniref:MerR family transcriptional regulator n=1 Tax=Streptomyces hazeniae TaxID=3075538 RepID=A0ABU2NSL2_9ACTN|nr:MerR family transcriptional regulator [Streptomyces sp. DSM 42041]MDT0379596.1 MerR family transcriptional regulator [Streptomyces sp. DSM 42041]
MTGADTAAGRLGTTAVARRSGYSPQQVRDLERLGVIAPASRAANGYRLFAEHHVRDLRAYRDLATAVGPVPARRALREIRSLPVDRAAALVSSFHLALARERDDALAAQEALLLIRAEGSTDAEPAAGDAMTIRELAVALGVPASTLRFWEKAELLTPERVGTRAGTARRYPVPVVREARIVAALRAAGYGVPEVRQTMHAIRKLREVEDPLTALAARVGALARRTLALLRAGSVLSEIIESPVGQPTRRARTHPGQEPEVKRPVGVKPLRS